jgi:hypothetical protein
MTTKTKKQSTARGKRTPEPAKRKVPVLGLVFGGVALALVAAIVFSSDETIGGAGEYGEPAVTGEALPLMDLNVAVMPNDPALGSIAPEVTGQDFDDSTVTIEHDGTPKAIVFLAHWCQHCQAEVPRVQAWLDGGGGVEGVEIVSVTTSANSGQPNWPPSAWLDRENWTSPNIRDDSESSALVAYGGRSFPYWVFVNGDGTVAHRQAGQTDIATLQAVMASLGPTG